MHATLHRSMRELMRLPQRIRRPGEANSGCKYCMGSIIIIFSLISHPTEEQCLADRFSSMCLVTSCPQHTTVTRPNGSSLTASKRASSQSRAPVQSIFLTSNEPDVLAIRQVLEELSNAERKIIIVAHSYGSIPTCEAAQGFGYQDRLKLGKPSGVIRLIFVAAWLLQEGENPPNIIERYKMESPWVRFEVGYHTFNSLLQLSRLLQLTLPKLYIGW